MIYIIYVYILNYWNFFKKEKWWTLLVQWSVSSQGSAGRDHSVVILTLLRTSPLSLTHCNALPDTQHYVSSQTFSLASVEKIFCVCWNITLVTSIHYDICNNPQLSLAASCVWCMLTLTECHAASSAAVSPLHTTAQTSDLTRPQVSSA